MSFLAPLPGLRKSVENLPQRRKVLPWQHQSTKPKIPELIALVNTGSSSTKKKAAAALATLANNKENLDTIVRADGILALVNLLRDGKRSRQTYAAQILFRLSENDDNKVLIGGKGGIPPLMEMMRKGNNSQKEVAASSLLSLSANADNLKAITSLDVLTVIALIRDGTSVQVEKAIGIFETMTSNMDTFAIVLQAGGVEILVKLMRDGSDAKIYHAIKALKPVSMTDTGKTVIGASGGIPLLVKLVQRSSECQEFALDIMWNLSVIFDNRVKIVAAGGIPVLVTLILPGNSRLRLQVVGVLTNLAMDSDKLHVVSIGAAIKAVDGISRLVVLLRDGTIPEQELALVLLLHLSAGTNEIKTKIVAEEVGRVLLRLATDAENPMKKDSLAVLDNLSSCGYRNVPQHGFG